jgi:tRNA (mo5U34)-methyltransferase
MINYEPLYTALNEIALKGSSFEKWLETLPKMVSDKLHPSQHGDLTRWLTALDNLPAEANNPIDLNSAAVRIGSTNGYDKECQNRLESALRELHPWRKGPFDLHGIEIDTEWRSDWKWERLRKKIQPLKNRLVLDIGCGNGYHCWRMLGEGAKRVIGIDPTLLSVMQFHAVKKLAGNNLPIDLLPIGIEALPAKLEIFDSVFSMGVLYHRRSPIDHLYELADCLRPGGELVLETLVIEGEKGQALLPEGRYAKMRNVWFIPSCTTLESWLKRCGYKDIKLIDVSPTTTEEQRSTDWMTFHSLGDFLDTENPELTCEGHPAPRRAIFTATKP